MMRAMMLAGVALALAGLLALAIPIFTTQQTREVARVGDLKLQTTESRSYAVPPMVAGGALTLGVVLIGMGYFRKR